MRCYIFTFLLSICTLNLLSQERDVYEDFYENGNIYLRGYTVSVDSMSSNCVGLWTYWYEDETKLSEEIRKYFYIPFSINNTLNL